MGFGSHYVNSPGYCFSTEYYNEWINKHDHNTDDEENDEKIFPKWFYLLFCDECKKYREFTNIICSHHLSHRTVITCNFCQNHFERFNDREVTYSPCCWSIESKLKNYTLGEFKIFANVYKKKKRKRMYIRLISTKS